MLILIQILDRGKKGVSQTLYNIEQVYSIQMKNILHKILTTRLPIRDFIYLCIWYIQW